MDDTAVAKRFAENLTAARKQAGLTIEALANGSEVHRSQVSELLGGKQVPRLTTIVRLAGALSVSPCSLMDGITFEPAEKHGRFKIARSKTKSS